MLSVLPSSSSTSMLISYKPGSYQVHSRVEQVSSTSQTMSPSRSHLNATKSEPGSPVPDASRSAGSPSGVAMAFRRAVGPTSVTVITTEVVSVVPSSSSTVRITSYFPGLVKVCLPLTSKVVSSMTPSPSQSQ